MKNTTLHRNIVNSTLKLLVVATLSLLAGCDSFVEVDQPNSQLTAGAVFDDRTTANAAVADLYAQMRESGMLTGKVSGLSILLGSYSDELVVYNGSSPAFEFYNNTVLEGNSYVAAAWNAAYNQIYAANMVYSKLENSTSLAENDKKQFQGEALFVRALNEFYLTSLFGDVPYITGTDYEQNSAVTRTETTEVNAHVIADLENAISLLSEEYITVDKVRASKAVAQALLARVYLYNGMYEQAGAMASTVLSNPQFVWEENLNNVFLNGSTSTIWQFASAYDGHNTDEAAVFIFPSGPPSTVALSENFVAQFTTGDLRRNSWIQEVTDGINTWYHSYKYKERNDTGASLEYSIVLRLAEQYLIRAEARARLGDLDGAKNDLNKIRFRAGLTDTEASNAAELLDAVMQERKFELFTEYGHRFFDLKRTGQLNTALNYKPGWNDTDALWPLPQSELLSNPSLGNQNPGY